MNLIERFLVLQRACRRFNMWRDTFILVLMMAWGSGYLSPYGHIGGRKVIEKLCSKTCWNFIICFERSYVLKRHLNRFGSWSYLTASFDCSCAGGITFGKTAWTTCWSDVHPYLLLASNLYQVYSGISAHSLQRLQSWENLWMQILALFVECWQAGLYVQFIDSNEQIGFNHSKNLKLPSIHWRDELTTNAVHNMCNIQFQ